MSQPPQRDLLARPTALGLAFRELYERLGNDVSNTRLPLKREPTWSVKRAKRG